MNFKEWLRLDEIIGPEVVDPYYLDDPQIGLDYKDQAKGEFYILFTILSAGKPSHQQARGLMHFLSFEEPSMGGAGGTPFHRIRTMIDKGTLVRNIARAGLGTFNRLARSFVDVSKVDLDDMKSWPPDKIEEYLHSIPNVSSKIVNFIKIYLNQDKGQPAVLDRHILRAMKRILQDMDMKGETLPARFTKGLSLAELQRVVPNETPSRKDYDFWAELWQAIMKKRKLKDLDVWRHQAMVGVDPMWRYKPLERGKLKMPVYTDPEGRDIINLSIDRKASEKRPAVKKDVFMSLDPHGNINPYTGQRRELFTPSDLNVSAPYAPEGDPLVKRGGTYRYRDLPFDQQFRGQDTPEAQAYRQRWIDTFRHYQQQGLYRGLRGKALNKYRKYLKLLGLQDVT